jgi:hypothetical protein
MQHCLCVQAILALTCKTLQPLLLSHRVSIHGTPGRQSLGVQDASRNLETAILAFNACLRKHKHNRMEELWVTADGVRDLGWENARPLPAVLAQTPSYR